LRARKAQKIGGRLPGSFFLALSFTTLVFWALLSAGRPAVAVAQSFEGETILSIEVISRVGMTIETLSRLTGIRTGIPYSRRGIRQSLDALYATGLFTDVVVDVSPIEGGVAVVYQFAEKAYLADLEFKGNLVFFDRRLTEAMGLQIGEEFTDERWKGAISRLVNFLQRQGYLRARVDSDVHQVPGTNQVKVVVAVNEGSRAKIREKTFVGETVYSNLRLKAATIRSNPGEYYRADILDEDIKRLEKFYHDNGYLRTVVGPPEVGYEETTNEVVITIPIEAGTRLDLRIEGNDPFTDAQLMPLLLFDEERSYDEGVFRASADRLADFYHSRGYPFAKVDYTREEVPSGEALRAVFIIQPGDFACLRTVLFVGNTFFSPDRLQEMIQTRPGNTLFCGTVDPDRVDADAKTIRARYHEQGFQEVKIEPRVEYNEARTLAYLIFPIAEGPRTVVADIRFEGQQVLSPDVLRKTIRMRSGQAYDEIPLRRDQGELLVLYHQHGYVYAEVAPQLDFSKDRTRVTIRYRISEGEQVRIGRILLNGNTFTKENVIRRELIVKPGDPYDETQIQISRHRIQQLGYLGNVRFEPIIPISREHRDLIKDMRLTVQERPTKTLDLGIGYADVEHLRGFIQGTHRNLGGTGRSLSLRLEGSEIERKYSTTYKEPWVLGFHIDGSLVAFDQTQVRTTYKLNTIGGTAGLEKNLTPTIRAVLQYQYEFNRYKQGVELLDEDKRANIGSLNPAILWDARDDPFNPSYGFLNSLTFQDAALSLGSQVQFVKGTARSSWYYPVTRWLVVALSARGGMANRFGQTKNLPIFGATVLLPPNNRFYIGGRSTVRGYAQDSLGIVNDTMVAKSDGSGVEFTGGNAMLLFNGELRVFLPGGLGLVFFNDRGNVFQDFKETNVNLLKSTIGAGIWYGTPVGPLRLDYGYKLDREKDLCIVPPSVPNGPYTIEKIPVGCTATIKESRAELHFTLGFAF
jgi:outer membrane protein insertion porin family